MNVFRRKQTSPSHVQTQASTEQDEQLVPASSGDSMKPFIDWIKQYSTLEPKTIFEIGANMAQDAEALREGFGVKPGDVWVFEPHPTLYKYIANNFDFNCYDVAVMDSDGEVVIHAINTNKNSNTGISSARKHLGVPESDFDEVTVRSIRMDTFIRQNSIDSIDFLKLDVEGCNYEVLDGFGRELTRVKALHVEAEHEESWEGEKLWEDVRKKLEKEFELVYFQRYYTQSDSFWIRKEYLKNPRT